jgi:site-specific DNA-methyltransferase (adenine-specific)
MADMEPIALPESWAVHEGDSRDVTAALSSASVGAIVGDPPYCSTGESTSFVKSSGCVSVPREVQFFEAWAREILGQWLRVLRPGGGIWLATDFDGAHAWRSAAYSHGMKAKIGIWDRGGLGMGFVLRNTHEYFIVIHGQGFVRRLTDEPDLWREPWSPGNRSTGHSAEKPVPLMRRAVRLVSDVGDLIYDPFTGTGATGVAAKIEGRRFIGAERDPEFAAKARARIGRAAGERVDAKNGQVALL